MTRPAAGSLRGSVRMPAQSARTVVAARALPRSIADVGVAGGLLLLILVVILLTQGAN